MKARSVSSRIAVSAEEDGDADEVGATAKLYAIARREWRIHCSRIQQAIKPHRAPRAARESGVSDFRIAYGVCRLARVFPAHDAVHHHTHVLVARLDRPPGGLMRSHSMRVGAI